MDLQKTESANLTCLATRRSFATEYVAAAPLALALERIEECLLLSKLDMPRPVLDLGCGDGIFAKLLFSDPPEYGLDPNPTELERARSIGAYQNYLNAFGADIPLPAKSVGTVISNSVLEHIPDLEGVLRSLPRVMKPGARAYFTVPTDDFERYSTVYRVLAFLGLKSLSRAFSAFYNKFWAHYHAYTPEEWTRLFERCGLRVERWERYCSPNRCTLHDVLVSTSLPSAFSRKFLNRWFAFPALRKMLAPLIVRALSPAVNFSESSHPRGGLVLFVVSPRSEAGTSAN